jgi:hypothetical protein
VRGLERTAAHASCTKFKDSAVRTEMATGAMRYWLSWQYVVVPLAAASGEPSLLRHSANRNMRSGRMN